MKSIRRWRYYCDYCKKSGGSKYHMGNHEASCTMNPDRSCSMCIPVEGASTSPEDLKSMVDIVKKSFVTAEDEYEFIYYELKATEKETLEKLRDITNCPACILAAIRQSGVPFLFPSFDYKEEKESLWADVNQDRSEAYAGCL